MKTPILESPGLESPSLEPHIAPLRPSAASPDADFLRSAETVGEANQSRLAAGLRFVLGAFREQTAFGEAAHEAGTPAPASEVNFIDDDGTPADRSEASAEATLEPRQVATLKSLDEFRQGPDVSVLLKSDDMRIFQLIVRAGKDVPIHEAAGALILQGLDGHVLVRVRNQWHDLRCRQLLFLTINEPFLIHGIEDSSLLLTVVAAKDGPSVELIG